MARNHAGRVFHGYSIFVHTRNRPSQPEWDEAIDLLNSAGSRLLGSLVYTEGGSPNAAQRKQLRSAYARHQGLPTAVLTESGVARAVITALNLFLEDKIVAFASWEIDDALRAIKAPAALWPELRRGLSEVRRLVG